MNKISLKISRAIKNAKKKLENKSICENFGIKEQMKIANMIPFNNNEILDFELAQKEFERFVEWCQNYKGK